MDGVAILSRMTIVPARSSWTYAGAGDFDGDGFTDLLLHNPRGVKPGRLKILKMRRAGVVGTGVVRTADGARFVTGPLAPTSGWRVWAVTDLNGDGRDDILMREADTNQLWIVLMNGTRVLSTAQVVGETLAPSMNTGEWYLEPMRSAGLDLRLRERARRDLI